MKRIPEPTGRTMPSTRTLERFDRQGKQVFYALADGHVLCTISDMVAHIGEHSDPEES